MNDQPFYDLPDVSRKLGNISRSTIYRLIEQRKLVRVNLGTKALITGESLAGYVLEILTMIPLSIPKFLHLSSVYQGTRA